MRQPSSRLNNDTCRLPATEPQPTLTPRDNNATVGVANKTMLPAPLLASALGHHLDDAHDQGLQVLDGVPPAGPELRQHLG